MVAAFVNGTLVASQLGSINALINDAPYTVPDIYTVCTTGVGTPQIWTTRQFAPGSLVPTLFNARFTLPIPNTPPSLQRLNMATLGVLAPTLYKSGTQVTAAPSANATVLQTLITAPSYWGNQVGYMLRNEPNDNTWADWMLPTDVFNLGSIDFPGQNFVNTGPFGGSLSTQPVATQSFLINYQNSFKFCSNVSVFGISATAFLIYGSSGFSQVVSPSQPILGQGNWAVANNILAIMPFAPLSPSNPCANVALSYDRNALKLVLIFFAADFSVLFMRYLVTENATVNAIINIDWANAQYMIQTCVSGFIITINVGGGDIANAKRYLFSRDGAYWAPITLNMVGPVAQKVTTPRSGAVASIALDPQGIMWYAAPHPTLANTTYIGYTFGTNLNTPIVPAFMNINLPKFDLPCFTPCQATQSGSAK